jgi:glucosylglycerol-phosphate synthase
MNTELVIVYHRQPYEEVIENGETVLREPRSPNGILPSIKGFFRHVDKAVWVAWKKSPAGKPATFQRRITMDESFGAYDVVRLPLDAAQIHQFYHVVSKEALWPVLNSFPWLYSSENTHWATFREVNRLFAEAACEQAEEGAVVWIHDYNLWLVPAFVRQLRPDLKIAFLHHTPFPGPDVFNIMPWRDEILDSLLSCDMIGFHVPRYSQNFVAVAQGLRAGILRHESAVPEPIRTTGQGMSEPVVTSRLEYQGRSIMIDTWPIGTDPGAIAATVNSEAGKARTAKVRSDLNAEILIVSVSRVDYAKGTRQQLDAFDRLLRRRPELIGRVKLLLVTVSAADGMEVYKAEQTKIEQMVGRINGHFGSMSWLPIMLSTTPLPFEEVVCAYRAADIAWITPLRDGLNLVAKEFVAAKQGESGVLVLSEFAGSAMELSDAVLANPFSRSSMDDAIDQALDMPEQERRARMQRLWAHVKKYDIAYWTRHVMDQFAGLTRISRTTSADAHKRAPDPDAAEQGEPQRLSGQT